MIVVLAGVAGSGKTTVGELLASELGWIFADGDDFHPPENRAKMHAGTPLTDADRWPWLRAIGVWMDERMAAGTGAVVACSALRRAYRDLLLAGRPEVTMVFLVVGRDADLARLDHRQGHFFPERLLASQFATLELPGPPERVTLVTAEDTAARTAAAIIDLLGLVPG